jgi:FKBP-type peptidyl-prolyl cis-trans isomerase 2
MKKFVILLLAALILLSGCVGQKAAVKIGDNISVNYIGRLQDGKVFDTNIETVAKENNLFDPGRKYVPLQFTVGTKTVIQGFDEGVVGMKVGDSKILTIPPEKGYGLVSPLLIQVMPIIENVSATREIPKVFEIPVDQFERTLGPNHSIGDIITIPETNINLTILNITSNVSLSYNLKAGDEMWSSGAPWNDTVVKVDAKNITIKANVSKNETIQYLRGAPWNTTVIGLNNVNITLRHNPIPETTVYVPGMFGQMVPMRVSFNKTSIILDQNRELAGKTLVFNVTVVSINK